MLASCAQDLARSFVEIRAVRKDSCNCVLQSQPALSSFAISYVTGETSGMAELPILPKTLELIRTCLTELSLQRILAS